MSEQTHKSETETTGIFHWSHLIVVGMGWFLFFIIANPFTAPLEALTDSSVFMLKLTGIIYVLRLFFHVRDGILRHTRIRTYLLWMIGIGTSCAFVYFSFYTGHPIACFVGAIPVGFLLVTLFYNFVRAEPSPIPYWS